MMKLLKYDWKRNATLILSTLVVLIVVQASITVFASVRAGNELLVLVLSIMGYSTAAILLFINSCKTYDLNIKAYSRRLLPIHPLKGVGANVLICWISLLSVGIIAAIHLTIYLNVLHPNIQELTGMKSVDIPTFIGITISTVWMITFLLLTIMVSITIARSFRTKKSTWIGIVSFLIIQSIVSWLELLLFNKNDGQIGIIALDVSSVEKDSISVMPSMESQLLTGPMIFELLLAAAFLYLMTYLLNKKVEL